MFALSHCFNKSIFYGRKCLDDQAQYVITALLIKRWVRCHLLFTMQAIKRNGGASWDLNPGLLGEKRERYLCAMPPPNFHKLEAKSFL